MAMTDAEEAETRERLDRLAETIDSLAETTARLEQAVHRIVRERGMGHLIDAQGKQ